MPDLERELRTLAGAVEFPPTPDVATAVRRRVAEEPPRRVVVTRRRWLAVALALLLAALGAALAVPAARTALLEWLGIRGVAVTRVETVPATPARPDLGLGERVTLAEARERAGFRVVVPRTTSLRRADAAFAGPIRAGGVQVSLVWWRADGGVELLLTQARASLERAFARKLAGPATTVEELSIASRPALWLEGEPHAFAYVSADGEIVEETLRLARNTLLWEHGGATFRLEGDVTRAEAIAIAESTVARGP